MKKNKTLRLASVLLILVMLTTSIIGGTFAKYTTTGSVSDTARVAKWGVVINTSGALYSNAYAAKADDGSGNLPAGWDTTKISDKEITVATLDNGTDKIVAPGTKSYGAGLSFGMSGKPEVAASLTAEIKAEDIFLKKGTYGVMVKAAVSDTESLKQVLTEYTDGVYSFKNGTYTKVDDATVYETDTEYYGLTNKVMLAEDYYPVAYTLTGSTNNTNSSDSKTADGVAKMLAKALNNGSEVTGTDDPVHTYSVTAKELPANTDLGAAASGLAFADEKLTWEWKFEDGASDDTKATFNAADTLLGDMIAAKGAASSSEFVSIDNTDGAATKLIISTDTNDYTVKNDDTVVANLNTQFSISLTVTQID